MSEADFQAVPEVEIDTGVFKYVLIRLYRFLETEIVVAGGIMFIFKEECLYSKWINAATAK